MKIETVWRVEQSIYRQSVDFLLIQSRGHDDIVGQPTEFMMVQADEGMVMQPTFSVTSYEAQDMMNGLWQAGFRPRDGSGAVAHVEATQAHLSDMRKIAFNRLKIDEAS